MRGLERPELARLHGEALARRSLLGLDCAAVAGSVGKTTVKEIVGAILHAWSEHSGETVFAPPANHNTKTHIASQIRDLPLDCRRAVFEVGARREGDFAFPLSLVQPRVVALLNVGSAHIGEFGSTEALWRTKLSALEWPTAEVLVVPADASRIVAHAAGTGKELLEFHARQSPNQLHLEAGGRSFVLEPLVASPGLARNLAAAAALGLALGIPLPMIEKGLRIPVVAPGRYERRSWRGKPVVDDAFNASPESLAAGLRLFAEEAGGRPVALVLGSMLELGAGAEAYHREIGRLIRNSFEGNILLLTVGEEAAWIGEEAEADWRKLSGREEAKRILCADPSWDLAYIKGSKATRLLGLLTEEEPAQ